MGQMNSCLLKEKDGERLQQSQSLTKIGYKMQSEQDKIIMSDDCLNGSVMLFHLFINSSK